MRTRFAPAPTGYLHLGHVLNAVNVWGTARARGGEVLLRVEDHDRQRSRAEYERALLEDLDWLGFEPDVYPTNAFRQGRCDGRQSDRDAVYRTALAPLIARGLVYGCDCSRQHLDAASERGGAYPGTCRPRGLPLRDDVGWRIRLDAATGDVGSGDSAKRVGSGSAAEGVNVRSAVEGVGFSRAAEIFHDERLGEQRQHPIEQCGDLLIRDRLGNWTYQWAATTDDTLQAITHVIRGEDLLESTGRQIALARLLGRDVPPTYLHHPLLMKSATQKLSKSDGDTGVRELRAAGWSAPQVIGHAVARVGLLSSDAHLRAVDVSALFAPRPAR